MSSMMGPVFEIYDPYEIVLIKKFKQLTSAHLSRSETQTRTEVAHTTNPQNRPSPLGSFSELLENTLTPWYWNTSHGWISRGHKPRQKTPKIWQETLVNHPAFAPSLPKPHPSWQVPKREIFPGIGWGQYMMPTSLEALVDHPCIDYTVYWSSGRCEEDNVVIQTSCQWIAYITSFKSYHWDILRMCCNHQPYESASQEDFHEKTEWENMMWIWTMGVFTLLHRWSWSMIMFISLNHTKLYWCIRCQYLYIFILHAAKSLMNTQSGDMWTTIQQQIQAEKEETISSLLSGAAVEDESAPPDNGKK